MALSAKAKAKAQAAASIPTSEIVDKLVDAASPVVDTPVAATNIFRKAGSLGIPSTIVFGNFVTGKSTLVRNLLLEQGVNPLWLALNNDTALHDPRVADWTIGSVGSWDEFNANVYKPAMRGELAGFDALVIDGGNVLTAMAIAKQAPNGQASQPEYLMPSNTLRDTIVKLREKFGKLFFIVDVVPTKTGRKIDLNPYTYNILVPLFGNKFYTNTIKERGDGNKLTGNKTYVVQRDAELALALVNGEAFEA